MKIEYMMIGAVLFGLVFVLGTSIYGNTLSKYDVDIDTSTTWGQMGSNAKQIYDYDKDMRGSIQGGTVTETNAVDDMIEGGYSAIKNNPYSAISVAGNATYTLMKQARFIPAPAITFILLTLSILTTFAIIALIFKFQQR